MARNRVFVASALFDRWVTEGHAELDGTTLRLSREEGIFSVVEAAWVVREVTGALDPHGLVGTAREVRELARLGGEVMDRSLVIGDFAYDVVPGVLARPLAGGRFSEGETKTNAVLATFYGLSETEGPRQSDEELLARYLTSNLE